MSATTTMKTCSKCEQVLPYSEYYSNGRGGKRADCPDCHNLHIKNKPVYRMRQFVKSRLKSHFKNKDIDMGDCEDALDCSYGDFNRWIEYNKSIDELDDTYHIDHIYPVSSSTATTWTEFVNEGLGHWSNMMPVEAAYNRWKGSRPPTHNYVLKCQIRAEIFKRRHL